MVNNNSDLLKKHSKHIKTFYLNKLAELYKEAEEIKEFLTDLGDDEESTTSNGKSNGATNKEDGIATDVYDKSWSNPKKVMFILKGGRKLTSGKIVDAMLEYESEKKGLRRKLVASISSLVGVMANEKGTLKREKNEEDEWVYYL